MNKVKKIKSDDCNPIRKIWGSLAVFLHDFCYLADPMEKYKLEK